MFTQTFTQTFTTHDQPQQTSFGYDAVVDRAHRRKIATITQAEDRELSPGQRRKLLAQSRDVRRNFELAAWAVRKHLDYVSSFSFRAATGNPDLDRKIHAIIREKSKPQNCDAAGRSSLRKLIRLAEALRTVDGDCGLLKLATGHVQIIEGDRIKDPPEKRDVDQERGITWTHGVKTDKAGRALAYAIHRRAWSRLLFERRVSSARLYLHGYFDRADQIRGISPFATALNRLRDTYENLDFALAKSKVSQLIGLVTNRNMIDDDFADEESCEEATAEEGFKLDPDKGNFSLDLAVGEDAKLLQSNQPSNEFQAFMQSSISIALKSIDLPYFFYDESKLNFFGGKVALSNYLISCNDKRLDNIDLLDWWTRWQLGTAVATGELDLSEFGLTWEDVADKWRWIPRGIPWWDKGREIMGDILAIHAGLGDWGTIIEERTGRQLEDVFDDLAEQQRLAKEKGIVLAGPKDLFPFVAAAARQSGETNE